MSILLSAILPSLNDRAHLGEAHEQELAPLFTTIAMLKNLFHPHTHKGLTRQIYRRNHLDANVDMFLQRQENAISVILPSRL